MPEKRQPSTPFFPSIRRLLQLAGRHKTWFVVSLVVDLVQAVLIVIQYHFLRSLFDAVQAANRQAFFTFLLYWLIAALVVVPLAFLRTRSLGWFSERTLAEIRQKVAARLNGLPVSYMEERHSGDFLSVINADLAKVKNLTGSSLLDLYSQACSGIGALVYIFFISWQLTLVSLLATPLVFVVLSAISAPIARRTNEMQTEVGALNSVAQDSLNGLPIAKSFNLERLLDERFKQANRWVIYKGLAIARLRSGVDILSTVVGFTPFLIAFGYGGYLAIYGMITFGAIFAFISLLNYVVNPLGNIPRLIASLSESIGAAQRIFQVLDHDLERSSGTVTRPPQPAGPVIRFNDLSFAYQPGTPILQQVNFEVQRGEKIAIVGPSGSGKSTLLKLILGYYPVADGRVYLYGEDLNRWKLEAARQQIALVAQDTYLFPVSMEENIACGQLGSGQDAIERAAAAANIHDFIQTLPQGYQTLVGERGARLSGGQKQRLALARAILKDAPVLLLDEPTSALDSESEALVQEALDRFMADHTTIVIAHRLSTIKNANRVLVLDQGQIIEQGTHEELLAKGGLYQELYHKQFGLVLAQGDGGSPQGDSDDGGNRMGLAGGVA
jgi:ABC-type multidrug transport system fused ATPase/permease subunit